MPIISAPPASQRPPAIAPKNNKLRVADLAAHDWYRFVLSFPPHLVRDYLQRFEITPRHTVLDPFCGTGTTLVECKKLGIPSVGIERNPMAQFATQVKLDWAIDPDGLLDHARNIARRTSKQLEAEGFDDTHGLPLFENGKKASSNLKTLPADAYRLILKDSISPVPLHKTLMLLEQLERQQDERYDRHERLALAKAIVFGISNLHFGPEVGIGEQKVDAPVVSVWLRGVQRMVDDLRALASTRKPRSTVHLADSRELSRVVEPESVDAVITSPPYPNEKDYTRTTRLESVLLGFIASKADLRAIKKDLVRSNTRSVYQQDTDDLLVQQHPEINRIAKAIEERRIALGKTSGFERMYHRVAKLYFGGMARHLSDLRTVLRPGAQLAYVVGDQASYLRVMIRTGRLLADIARSLDYEVTGIDLFRTRLATATREQLREEVVLLRWPGKRRGRQ